MVTIGGPIARAGRFRSKAYDARQRPQLNCAGEIAGLARRKPRFGTGGADGATARNLSGTRDRAGMGTLESVADGSDPAERAPTEEPAVADAPRGRSQAPGQRGTEEGLF